MDYLCGLIIDLILEEGINVTNGKKIPKPIRYILLGFILLLYIAIIGFITLIGILELKDNLVEGIFILLFGLCFLLLCIIRFRAVYKKNKNKID